MSTWLAKETSDYLCIYYMTGTPITLRCGKSPAFIHLFKARHTLETRR